VIIVKPFPAPAAGVSVGITVTRERREPPAGAQRDQVEQLMNNTSVQEAAGAAPMRRDAQSGRRHRVLQ
jgi:hypothetical protein